MGGSMVLRLLTLVSLLISVPVLPLSTIASTILD